jgi:hypothetical protein
VLLDDFRLGGRTTNAFVTIRPYLKTPGQPFVESSPIEISVVDSINPAFHFLPLAFGGMSHSLKEL